MKEGAYLKGWKQTVKAPEKGLTGCKRKSASLCQERENRDNRTIIASSIFHFYPTKVISAAVMLSIVTPVIVAMKTTLSSSNSCIIWPRDYRYLVRRVK